jgi:hypothetical protein
MKALSIRQPWAHLIVKGIKRVENRDWSTLHRGPLLIHAAQQLWQKDSIEQIERRYRVRIPAELFVGAIIGRVDLVDVVTRSDDPFFYGPFGFVLANACELQPVSMPGRQKIFDVPDY